MAADIYTMFRRFIGDYTPDYTLPDLETLAFLDLGIDKASEMLNRIIIEDITITSEDVTNGYFTLTYEIESIIDTELGIYNEHDVWETEGDTNKIFLLDTDYVTTGTYEFKYKRKYNKFDGVVKSNDDFNHPTGANLGIVLWALAEYQITKGLINADNSANLIISKSEEGMSVSYGSGTALKLSSPTELKQRAMEIFNSVSNRNNINFSITV